ncbi:MAG TPA: hypothetical protein VG142_17870 [Trebonia sp.]|nr:hypothetical protein [Trebonia sp.]
MVATQTKLEEELLTHSPTAHVRRPRLDYESQATALERNELGAVLLAGGLGPPAEQAPISLLALNGLRVSEATGADIEHLGLERGRRPLVITRKGGKVDHPARPSHRRGDRPGDRPGDRRAGVDHAKMDFLGGDHDAAPAGDAPLDGDGPGRASRDYAGAAGAQLTPVSGGTGQKFSQRACFVSSIAE